MIEKKRNISMARSALTSEKQAIAQAQGGRIGGLRFDRIMIVFCCWFLGGLYLDGWAHNHGLVDKTFFTPWHAVLYSGYFANAVLLVGTVVINHLRGYRWQQAIPSG